jgi:hypothetical protein
MCAAPSCTTCVTAAASRLASKKSCRHAKLPPLRLPFDLIQAHNKTTARLAVAVFFRLFVSIFFS